MKWFESGGEASERSCDLAVIANETSIKVGETQEVLELLAKGGSGPFRHRVHLGRIWSELPLLYHEAQEGNRGSVKLTFLCLHKQLVFQKTLKHEANMLDVVPLKSQKKIQTSSI